MTMDEQQKQLAAAVAFEQDVMALVGVGSKAEVIGAIVALKNRAAEADRVSAELAQAKAAREAAEVAALLDGAIVAGQIDRSKRGEMEALHKAHGADALRACLALLPKRPVAAQAPVAQSANAEGLTADEEKLIKMLGVDRAKYIEGKRARNAFRGLDAEEN